IQEWEREKSRLKIFWFCSAAFPRTDRTVYILEARTWNQRRNPRRHHYILVQQRPPDDADPIVKTYGASDVGLEQQSLERLCVLESQIIDVEDGFQFLRQVGVGADVVKEDAGIDKIRLAFELAAAEARKQAVFTDQGHSGLGQPNLLAVPEAELAAGKFGKIENGVEPSTGAVKGIFITRSPKERSAYSEPVSILRKLDRRHLSIDVNRPASDRVVAIVAERLVERVSNVQPADVPVSIQAQVCGLDAVRSSIADERRPDRKAVLIEMYCGLIVVVQEAELRRIPFPYRVLAIDVCNVDILVSEMKRVEVAVGVLL